MPREKTVRAQHYAPVCLLLEQEYHLTPGTVYYIDVPYEKPPPEPAKVEVQVEPEKRRKRRKL